MRTGFGALVAVLAVLSAAAVYRTVIQNKTNPAATVPREIIKLYAQWKQSHGKLYATPAEDSHRLTVFYSQKQFIDKANVDYADAMYKRDGVLPEVSAFSLNSFADLTSEEFRVKYTSGVNEKMVEQETVTPFELSEQPKKLRQVPPSSEYPYYPRQTGAYATGSIFPFIEAYEKHYFDMTGIRANFSQQEVIDCQS